MKKSRAKSKLIIISQYKYKALGKIGDIVSVKRGFARNLLVPQGFALYATQERLKNKTNLENEAIENFNKKNDEALNIMKILSAAKVIIPAEFLRVDSGNTLYSALKTNDIVYILNSTVLSPVNKSYQITPRNVILAKPIKKLGDHIIQIKLFNDHSFQMILPVHL